MIEAGHLADCLDFANGLVQWDGDNPLRSIHWTNPQEDFRRLCPKSKRKLLRAGNQVGKTWAGCAEVIEHCLGIFPHYKLKPPPIECLIICSTWKQSVAIMKKFWDLVPKSEVADGQRFSRRTGFGKDNPTFMFRNGSIVFFSTDDAGPRSIQGMSPNLVLIDELCSEEMYREADRRVMRTGGWIILTFTPVNNPAGWAKELVRLGVIAEVWTPLTVAAVTPVGTDEPLTLPDGTPMDEEWIADQRLKVFPWAAGVILDGEWEFRSTDQIFTAFDPTLPSEGPATHVNVSVPTGDVDLCLGIDYGTKVGKQVAILVAVQGKGPRARLWVLDMVRDEHGRSSLDEDADALLEMLGRHGQSWRNLRHAYGDRAHLQGADRKQNVDLERRLRKRLNVKRLTPPLWTSKRGAGGGKGSVFEGCRWLHDFMIRPGAFNIHPRCRSLIEDLQKWDGADTQHKDAIDALRYSLEAYIFGTAHGNRTVRMAA